MHAQAIPFSSELECVGHPVHVPGPLTFLYLPATHCEHAPPSSPEKPGKHEHVALPLAEFEFSVHGKQCVVLFSAKLFENVLDWHFRQVELSGRYLK